MTKRWTAILVGAGLAIALLMLSPRVNVANPDPGRGAAQLFAPEPSGSPSRADEEAVRIQYDVLVVQPAPPRRVAPRPPAVVKAHAPAAPRATPAVRQRDPGVAARAGRILVGDGRYRPEPFPKLAAGK